MVVVVMTTNYRNGEQLYPDWNATASFMGSLYGPYVFLIQEAALPDIYSVANSKLIGVVAAIVSTVMVLFAARKSAGTWTSGFLSVAFLFSFICIFQHYWLWNRPNSFLIMAVAISAAALVLTRPVFAAAVIGASIGFAANLKLHSPIYFIPLLVELCIHSYDQGRLIRPGVAGIIGFVLVFFAPFLLPGIELNSYLANVFMAASHGLRFDLFRRLACPGHRLWIPLIFIAETDHCQIVSL